MKYIKSIEGKNSSAVALGCMRIGDMSDYEMDRYLATAFECGYNYFDHADIYHNGRCEEVFAKARKRNKVDRDKIIIQTKCGIREGMYDFSYEHIINSVDKSLKRLDTDYVDVLLLHRPDLLMDPEEVARAFDELEHSQKVRAFGVSNHSAAQIKLLNKYLNQRICINQLQLSITDCGMISSGAGVNTTFDEGINRDGYIRDYCRLHDITVQPWSPLQYGFFSGTFLDKVRFPDLCAVIDEIAEKYNVSDTGVAIAWLLRLPEKMQPVIGSTNIDRIKEIARATHVEMSREDWYKIYRAAGHILP